MSSPINYNDLDLSIPNKASARAAALGQVADEQPEELHQFQPVKQVVVIALALTGLKGNRADALVRLAEKIDRVFTRISNMLVSQEKIINDQTETMERLSASLIKEQEVAAEKQLDLEKKISEAQELVNTHKEKSTLAAKKLTHAEIIFAEQRTLTEENLAVITKEKIEKEEEFQKLSTLVNSLKQETSTLRRDQKELLETMKKQLADAKLSRDKLEEQYERVVTELSLASEELKGQKNYVSSLETTNAVQKNRVSQLQATSMGQVSSLSVASKELEAQRAVCEKLSTESSQKEEEIKKLQAELKSKKNHITQLQEMNADKASKIIGNDKIITLLKKSSSIDLEEKEDQKKLLTQQKTALEKNEARLKEVETKSEDLEKQIRFHKETNSQLQNNIQKLQLSHTALEEKEKSIMFVVSIKEEVLQQKKNSCSELEKEIDSLYDKIFLDQQIKKETSKEIAFLKEQLSQAEKEKKDAKAEYLTTAVKLGQNSLELNKVRITRKQLSEEIEINKKTIGSLETKLGENSFLLIQLQSEARQKDNKIEELEGIITLIEKQMSIQNISQNQKLREIESVFSQKIIQQTEENRRLREKLEAAEFETQRQKEQFEERVKLLNAEIDKEGKVKELSSVLAGVQGELENRTLSQQTIRNLTSQSGLNEPGGPRHVAFEALRQKKEDLDLKRDRLQYFIEENLFNLINERNTIEVPHNELLKLKASNKSEQKAIQSKQEKNLQEIQLAGDKRRDLYREMHQLRKDEVEAERVQQKFLVQWESLDAKKFQLMKEINELNHQYDIKDRELRDLRDEMECKKDYTINDTTRQVEKELNQLELLTQELIKKKNKIEEKQKGFKEDTNYLENDIKERYLIVDREFESLLSEEDCIEKQREVEELDKRLETLFEELEEIRYEIKKLERKGKKLESKEQDLFSSETYESRLEDLQEAEAVLTKAMQPRKSPFQWLVSSISG
jgi:chromosome segregation protein